MNNFIFKALHVIAWVIFVGLCIEAGALLVNLVFALFKPSVVANLYQKLDLSRMYAQNKFAFFSTYSFVVIIALLKAYLFYVVIELLYKLDLKSPFNGFVAKKIEQISYQAFSIGILSYLARETTQNLSNHGYDIDHLSKFWVDSQAFILMAAIIYIIATIFKKGIEIQQENDLTV